MRTCWRRGYPLFAVVQWLSRGDNKYVVLFALCSRLYVTLLLESRRYACFLYERTYAYGTRILYRVCIDLYGLSPSSAVTTALHVRSTRVCYHRRSRNPRKSVARIGCIQLVAQQIDNKANCWSLNITHGLPNGPRTIWNEAIVNNRLRPGAKLQLIYILAVLLFVVEHRLWLESRLLCLSCPVADLEYARRAIGPSRENVTSSAKPEVHNVSQRRRRRTEPRSQATWTRIWLSSVLWFSSYASGQTDRQTNIGYILVAVLRIPSRGRSITCNACNWRVWCFFW